MAGEAEQACCEPDAGMPDLPSRQDEQDPIGQRLVF